MQVACRSRCYSTTVVHMPMAVLFDDVAINSSIIDCTHQQFDKSLTSSLF